MRKNKLQQGPEKGIATIMQSSITVRLLHHGYEQPDTGLEALCVAHHFTLFRPMFRYFEVDQNFSIYEENGQEMG